MRLENVYKIQALYKHFAKVVNRTSDRKKYFLSKYRNFFGVKNLCISVSLNDFNTLFKMTHFNHRLFLHKRNNLSAKVNSINCKNRGNTK